MKRIHIELELLSTGEERDEIDPEEIKDTILANESEFTERMALMCCKHDMRAALVDDSLEVEDINLSEQGGVASVVYEYSAYYGCKDMDHSDGIQDNWEFGLKVNRIFFDLELPEIIRDDEI